MTLTLARSLSVEDRHPVPDLDAADWPEAPSLVDFRGVVATQFPAYSPCGKTRKRLGEPTRGGQPYPLVLVVSGVWYLYDGHTRVALRLREGNPIGLARVRWWRGKG